MLLVPNSCFLFDIQICPSSQSTLCLCYFVLCKANYIFLITCNIFQYMELIDITRKLTTYLPIANTSYNNFYVQVRGERTVFARFRSKLHVR